MSIADYNALKARLLESDLAELSDEEAEAALAATTTRPVPGRYLTRGGVLTVLVAADPTGALFESAWGWLETAAESSHIAKTALNSLDQATGGVDFGGTVERTLLDLWVTQGFPSEARDALQAYGSETITRGEAIDGWGLVTTAEAIRYARAWTGEP